MAGERIALVIPDLSGGGAERVLLVLAHAFRDRGYQVDVVLARARGEWLSEVPDGARVIDLKVDRLRDAVQPLRRYFKSERPDATQVSMWPLTSWAALAHRLAGKPGRLVLSDHCNLSLHYAPKGKLHERVMAATVALTYPLADARVAVSRGVAEDIARLSGLRPDSFTVVPNPMAAPDPALVDSAEARPFWGEGTAKRILAVGMLVHDKNFPLLVRAFARLQSRMDAKLVIVGEGPDRSRIEQTVAEQGVTDSVALPGFFSEPWPFFAAADLFALSSDREGFAIVLIEALHFGLPVVSTDCPSGPADILKEPFGKLAPCGDAEALATAMAEMLERPHDPGPGKHRVAEFAPARIAVQYLELLIGPGVS